MNRTMNMTLFVVGVRSIRLKNKNQRNLSRPTSVADERNFYMIFIIHRHETLLFYDLWFYIDFDETMIDIDDKGILLSHLHVNVRVVAFISRRRQPAVKFPFDYLVLDLLMCGRSELELCEERAKYDEKSIFSNMIFPAHVAGKLPTHRFFMMTQCHYFVRKTIPIFIVLAWSK